MSNSKARYTSQLVWGGVLLLMGTAMLLSNLEILEIGSVWRHWPAIIVAMGIGKLISAESTTERGQAVWWIFIGAWLYVSAFRVFGFGWHDSWPILLVGLGVSMVLKSMYAHSWRATKELSHE